MTYALKPGKLIHPVLPVSTAVVTPTGRQTASGSARKGVILCAKWPCRSIRPGTTSLPFTSTVSSDSGLGISSDSAATFPPAKAMSSESFNPCEGSIILPPFRSRSYFAAMVCSSSSAVLETRATLIIAQCHRVDYLGQQTVVIDLAQGKGHNCPNCTASNGREVGDGSIRQWYR